MEAQARPVSIVKPLRQANRAENVLAQDPPFEDEASHWVWVGVQRESVLKHMSCTRSRLSCSRVWIVKYRRRVWESPKASVNLFRETRERGLYIKSL